MKPNQDSRAQILSIITRQTYFLNVDSKKTKVMFNSKTTKIICSMPKKIMTPLNVTVQQTTPTPSHYNIYFNTTSVFYKCVYLEAQDDGPDKAQGKAVVSIHNIMGTNIFQVNPLFFKKLEGFVDVLQAVDPHTTPCRPRLRGNQRD